MISSSSASSTTSIFPGQYPREKRQWNVKNLPSRLGTDLVSATTAGALIAPLISIIDRSVNPSFPCPFRYLTWHGSSIMENASGRAPSIPASLLSSFRSLVSSPRSILLSRPTALILLLYAGTYLTANTLDTVSSALPRDPSLSPPVSASTVSSGPAKFFSSSAANVALCIYKDRAFVRMFGTPTAAGAPRPVPLPCYALFTLRDSITIFASFNLPPLLAPYIDERLSDELARHVTGQTTAQFLAPAAVQLLSTPLHLLGLDLYNRPGRPPVMPWAHRWRMVKSNWLLSSAARICRIVPAFGVGGVVNTKVRYNLMKRLE
ncbi:hypothetical protein RJ55_06443 [Drechmeria coniospora]|nr:hypothetical protein RJ55_06443 [Drechmeria coniospora]